MRNELIDLGLVATSSAYAAWLAEHKHAEPDGVWAEVAIGVGYTLLAARLKRRIDAPAGWPGWARWLMRDAHVWLSFGFSSAPIIVGELAQGVKRRQMRRRYAARWNAEV